MVAVSESLDRYQLEFDNSADLGRFERFEYRHAGKFPVRTSDRQIRARLRSRGRAAARRKARSFNGINRRGNGRRGLLIA